MIRSADKPKSSSPSLLPSCPTCGFSGGVLSHIVRRPTVKAVKLDVHTLLSSQAKSIKSQR